MKKLLKRIAPLLLALVMVLGSCLTVSAADTDTTWEEYYNSKTDSWKAKYPYFFVYDWGSVYNVKFCTAPVESPVDRMGVVATTKCEIAGIQVNKSTMKDSSSATTRSLSAGSLYSCGNVDSSNFVYTNFDIWEVGADKSVDQPVFRGPVPPLVGAVQGAAPEEALKEVILLIPLSILFLAGCLGLRKGLRLLLTLLHQA